MRKVKLTNCQINELGTETNASRKFRAPDSNIKLSDAIKTIIIYTLINWLLVSIRRIIRTFQISNTHVINFEIVNTLGPKQSIENP